MSIVSLYSLHSLPKVSIPSILPGEVLITSLTWTLMLLVPMWSQASSQSSKSLDQGSVPQLKFQSLTTNGSPLKQSKYGFFPWCTQLPAMSQNHESPHTALLQSNLIAHSFPNKCQALAHSVPSVFDAFSLISPVRILWFSVLETDWNHLRHF